MAIIESGDSADTVRVSSAFKALHVTQYPATKDLLGAYSLSVVSGVMAAGLAANSEIFQFRWTEASKLMVPRRITVSGGGITAFTAGFGKYELILARGWTVDGTGGTAILFTGADTQKKRATFAATVAPSNLGVRIASTAALGAGTKTLDTNAFAGQGFGVTATAGASLGGVGADLWLRDTGDEYPIVLAANEGLVVRATVPATGTWTFSVTVEWAEFSSY